MEQVLKIHTLQTFDFDTCRTQDLEVLICEEGSSPKHDCLITYAVTVLQFPTLVKGSISSISEDLSKLAQKNKLLYINDNEDAFLAPRYPRGILIVLEGPDGVGKSSHVKRIAEKLPNVETLTFPERSSAYGKLIRRILSSDEVIDRQMLNTLFILNRFDKKSLIDWWLWKGKTIIVDRYSISNIAYQLAQNWGESWTNCIEISNKLDKLESGFLNNPRANKTIILLEESEVCMKRVKQRGEPMDHDERKGIIFSECLNHAYRLCAESIPDCIKVEGHGRSFEEINDDIVRRISTDL